jgi:hypothetical protein
VFFVELGKFLSQFSENNSIKNLFCITIVLMPLKNSSHYHNHNGWYTPEQHFSIQSWAALTEENLNQWLSNMN